MPVVAVKIRLENPPVDGLYCNLVDEVYSVVTLPLVALTNTGYLVAFVVVSSCNVTLPPGAPCGIPKLKIALDVVPTFVTVGVAP